MGKVTLMPGADWPAEAAIQDLNDAIKNGNVHGMIVMWEDGDGNVNHRISGMENDEAVSFLEIFKFRILSFMNNVKID